MSGGVRREVLRLERQQASAFNRGDVAGALQIFDKGFVGFSSTRHERIRGLRALARTFHYYLRRAPKLTYRIEQPHVHTSGDTAVATFYWTVELGRGRAVRGRGTHVFARKGRSWRVIHEHFSRAHRSRSRLELPRAYVARPRWQARGARHSHSHVRLAQLAQPGKNLWNGRRSTWRPAAHLSQNSLSESRRMVTGPSFVSSTDMRAWKTPVSTRAPSARRARTNSS